MRNARGWRLGPVKKSLKIQVSVGQVIVVDKHGSTWPEDNDTEIQVEILGQFGEKVIGEVLRPNLTGIPHGLLVELVGYEIGLPF